MSMLPSYAQPTASARLKQMASRSRTPHTTPQKPQLSVPVYGSVPYSASAPKSSVSSLDYENDYNPAISKDHEAQEMLHQLQLARIADAKVLGEPLSPRSVVGITHDAQAASYLPAGAGGAGALLEELRHAKYTLAQLQDRLGAQEREVRHRDSIIRMQAERLHKAQTLCNVSESVSLAKQREVDELKQKQLLASLALRSAVRDRDASTNALRDMTVLSELALQQEQDHLERNKELTMRAAQMIKRGEKAKAERLLAAVRDSVATHQSNIVYPLKLDSERLSALLAHSHIDQMDKLLDTAASSSTSSIPSMLPTSTCAPTAPTTATTSAAVVSPGMSVSGAGSGSGATSNAGRSSDGDGMFGGGVSNSAIPSADVASAGLSTGALPSTGSGAGRGYLPTTSSHPSRQYGHASSNVPPRPQTPLPPVPVPVLGAIPGSLVVPPPLPPVPAHLSRTPTHPSATALSSPTAASSSLLYPPSVNQLMAEAAQRTMHPFYEATPSLRAADLALVRNRAMHGLHDNDTERNVSAHSTMQQDVATYGRTDAGQSYTATSRSPTRSRNHSHGHALTRAPAAEPVVAYPPLPGTSAPQAAENERWGSEGASVHVYPTSASVPAPSPFTSGFVDEAATAAQYGHGYGHESTSGQGYGYGYEHGGADHSLPPSQPLPPPPQPAQPALPPRASTGAAAHVGPSPSSPRASPARPRATSSTSPRTHVGAAGAGAGKGARAGAVIRPSRIAALSSRRQRGNNTATIVAAEDIKAELPDWLPAGVKSLIQELIFVLHSNTTTTANTDTSSMASGLGLSGSSSQGSIIGGRDGMSGGGVRGGKASVAAQSVKALMLALCTMFKAHTDRQLQDLRSKMSKDIATLQRRLDHSIRHEDKVQLTRRQQHLLEAKDKPRGCQCGQKACVCYARAIYRRAHDLLPARASSAPPQRGRGVSAASPSRSRPGSPAGDGRMQRRTLAAEGWGRGRGLVWGAQGPGVRDISGIGGAETQGEVDGSEHLSRFGMCETRNFSPSSYHSGKSNCLSPGHNHIIHCCGRADTNTKGTGDGDDAHSDRLASDDLNDVRGAPIDPDVRVQVSDGRHGLAFPKIPLQNKRLRPSGASPVRGDVSARPASARDGTSAAPVRGSPESLISARSRSRPPLSRRALAAKPCPSGLCSSACTCTPKSDPLVLAAALKTVKQLAQRAEAAEHAQLQAESRVALLEQALKQLQEVSARSAMLMLRRTVRSLEDLQFGVAEAIVRYRDRTVTQAIAYSIGTDSTDNTTGTATDLSGLSLDGPVRADKDIFFDGQQVLSGDDVSALRAPSHGRFIKELERDTQALLSAVIEAVSTCRGDVEKFVQSQMNEESEERSI